MGEKKLQASGINDSVLNGTELINLTANLVARLHPQLWLPAHAHTMGGASEDEVAWLQGHNLGDVLEHAAHVKDELACVGALDSGAVEDAADTEVVGVEGVRAGQQQRVQEDGGSDGGEGVPGLAEHPLAASLLELEVTGRDIIAYSVPSEILKGVATGDVLGLATHHQHQLHLIVQLIRQRGLHYVLATP